MKYRKPIDAAEVSATLKLYSDIFSITKTGNGAIRTHKTMSTNTNPFKDAKELTSDFTKWDKDSNPNIVGFYSGDKEIDNKGEKFIVHKFTDVVDADSGEELGDLELPSMTMLKNKIYGHIGKKLGIAYGGVHAHPTKRGKTLNQVAVYLM